MFYSEHVEATLSSEIPLPNTRRRISEDRHLVFLSVITSNPTRKQCFNLTLHTVATCPPPPLASVHLPPMHINVRLLRGVYITRMLNFMFKLD